MATAVGMLDCYLVKFDSSGNFIYVKTWGGPENDKCYQVAIDKSNNLYLTGWFYDTVDFDPGQGVHNATSNGLDDTYLLKLTQDGNFVWVKTWGGTQSDGGGHGVAVDSAGEVYVCGHFRETVDFDPGPDTDIHTFHGLDDGYVTAFDSDGNHLWARTWGTPTGAYSYGLAIDSDRNVIITGEFAGDMQFPFGRVMVTLSSHGQNDAFMCKFDHSGNFFWADEWGGTGMDTGHTVTVDGSGNIYGTGRFQGTVDFDPTDGVDNHTSGGVMDAFLEKVEGDGVVVRAVALQDFKWQIRLPGRGGPDKHRGDIMGRPGACGCHGIVVDQ